MRSRLLSIAVAVVGLLCVADLSARQSTVLAPSAFLKLDSSGYINVTATGAGTGTQTTNLWSNTFVKLDSSGYLKINCQSGCGSVGGSTLDVQCNVSSALSACETGVFTHDSATHITKMTKTTLAPASNAGYGWTDSTNNLMGHENGTNTMYFRTGGTVKLYMNDSSDAHQAMIFGQWNNDGGGTTIPNSGATAANLLKAHNAGGGNSNRGGTNVWLGAGESTGNGTPGDVVFLPGTLGASGTTERAIAEGARVSSTALTFNFHLVSGGTQAPAVTNTSANSCGTTAASISGTDTAGKVTVGATSGTSCTVTFAAAFSTAPSCFVMDETTAVLARATSTTTTVIFAGVFTAADVLAYACVGR